MSEFKVFYEVDKKLNECQEYEFLNFYQNIENNKITREIYNQIQKTDLSKNIIIVCDKDIGKCENAIIREALRSKDYEIKVEKKTLLGLERWRYKIWKRL